MTHVLRPLAAILVVTIAVTGKINAQESASFLIERVSVCSAAGDTASVNYVASLTLGETGPVGAASFCNTGFVVSTGLWSVLGGPTVPIRLYLEHNALDPVAADLTWSGGAAAFDIFRSTSPDNVLEPFHLLETTPTCRSTDPQPIDSGIFFYLVVQAPEVGEP